MPLFNDVFNNYQQEKEKKLLSVPFYKHLQRIQKNLSFLDTYSLHTLQSEECWTKKKVPTDIYLPDIDFSKLEKLGYHYVSTSSTYSLGYDNTIVHYFTLTKNKEEILIDLIYPISCILINQVFYLPLLTATSAILDFREEFEIYKEYHFTPTIKPLFTFYENSVLEVIPDPNDGRFSLWPLKSVLEDAMPYFLENPAQVLFLSPIIDSIKDEEEEKYVNSLFFIDSILLGKESVKETLKQVIFSISGTSFTGTLREKEITHSFLLSNILPNATYEIITIQPEEVFTFDNN